VLQVADDAGDGAIQLNAIPPLLPSPDPGPGPDPGLGPDPGPDPGPGPGSWEGV